MTVSFHTLGCKLNFAETSTISRLFTDNGYSRVKFGQPADVTVINTCTVTAQSDRKCRQVINKAIKTSPEALVVVIGCFAEHKAAEIAAIEGVDIVLGNKEKFNIIEHINNRQSSVVNHQSSLPFISSYSLFDRARSFLKVQDGCDYRCAYCIVPIVRGASRNAPIVDVVEQAKNIAAQGIKEIVLTGVNIGDFGKTTGETFMQLLRALDTVDSVERIRIGSIEPNMITEEMIKYIADSKIYAPHFHMSLQSGCNKILSLMGRLYTREQFAMNVALIHRYMPRAAVGADVIVGFPGETDSDFSETFDFIESLNIAYLHVFAYSERPGTKAVEMPDRVKSSIADCRTKKLLKLSEEKRMLFYKQNIGQCLPVIFEQKTGSDNMTGYTDSYIRVEAAYYESVIGKTVLTEMIGISESCNTGLIAFCQIR